MTGHESGDSAAAAGHDIHLPPPSLAPVVVAIGVTLIAYGILFGLLYLAVGGLLFVAGLTTWLVDDARAMVATGPHDDGHGGHS